MAVLDLPTSRPRAALFGVGLLVAGTVLAPTMVYIVWIGALDGLAVQARAVALLGSLLVMFTCIPLGLFLGTRKDRKRRAPISMRESEVTPS